MADHKRIEAAFSKAATAYDEHAKLQHAVREECVNIAQSVWAPEMHILDLGAGTGILSAEAKERELEWEITHLDLSWGMCKKAQERNAQVVCASSDALPFMDAGFDGVFSSLMLQWAGNPVDTFREMARVLRAQGTCVIATFAEGTLDELKQAFTAIDDASHVNSFANPASITALAAHAGFKLLAAEQETFTTGHNDITSLMRSLKVIGASTKQGTSRKGLMTPSQVKALEQEYRRLFVKKKSKKGTDTDLPATWQVLYMLLEKQ